MCCSALFKLDFSHSVFLSLLMLSLCSAATNSISYFTYLLFHNQLPPFPFRSHFFYSLAFALSSTRAVWDVREVAHCHCALQRADVADYGAELWAVSSELCVSFFFSLSLTLYLLSYGICSDRPPAPYFCIFQANNAKQNNVNREAWWIFHENRPACISQTSLCILNST